MGASGIAPSFAAVYGGKLLPRSKMVILFGLFVAIGAFAFGGRVAKTLSSGIIEKGLFNQNVALIILVSAALSLFVANLIRVPQSTSWVTVFATFGAALYFGNLNLTTVIKMVLMWTVLPASAFVITYVLFNRIYPPRFENLRFYEKVHCYKKQIQLLAIAASSYVAFSIGSNNVANAVGPLLGADLISPFLAFLLISPLFGLGGLLIGNRTMKTMGEEIVPLGIIASTLVSLVTASLLLFASVFGFPQSLVQLNAAAIFGIGAIKHKHFFAAKEKNIRMKIFATWMIAPFISLILSFLLLKIVNI